MRIQSMTGFGKSEVDSGKFSVTVEIKSVNNRYRDIRFRMPQSLNFLEIDLRKKISDAFKRGSFEVFIGHKKSESAENVILCEQKIKSFLSFMSSTLKGYEDSIEIRPCDFIRPEFYIEKTDDEVSKLTDLVYKVFDDAIISLKESRIIEGEKLVDSVVIHQKKYSDFLKIVEENESDYRKSVEERLLKKIDDYKESIKVDNQRMLQEVVYYLEKLDVTEEIERITIHLSKLSTILKSKGEIGRQMDFLVQELNRETNTIGSKSGSSKISEAVVQMKTQLEKIREQGLNLE